MLKFVLGFILYCPFTNTFVNVNGVSDNAFAIEFSIVDRQGKTVSTAPINEEMFVKVDIENVKDDPQNFTAIVLVKDFTNITEEVMLEEGTVVGHDEDTISLVWIPEKYGMYLVELFVWDSLVTARPLLPNPVSVSINIVENQNLEAPISSVQVDDEHMAGIIVNAFYADGILSFSVNSSANSPSVYVLIVSSSDKGLFSGITNTPQGWSSHSLRHDVVGWSTYTNPIKPNTVEHNFSAGVGGNGEYEFRWSVLDDTRSAVAWGTLTIDIS
jgi:hypothetical protein